MELRGRIAIVTGASSGFGRSTALRMSEQGAGVVLVDVDVAGGARALDELRTRGGEGEFVEADIGTAEGARHAVGTAVARFGGVDVLVNNAGVRQGQPGSTWDCDEDEWDHVLQVNLKSVYLCTRAVVPIMTERGGGSIVNVASIAVHMAVGGVAYAASKGGIASFSKHTAYELAPRQIRVNYVCPGFMRTPMSTGQREGATAEEQEAWVQARTPLVPLGRVGAPEDIAAAICFLAGDAARYITGQEIVVDGGVLVRGPQTE